MRSGQEGSEKGVRWNEERVKYWLSLGAKPSKTVERLLNQAGIISTQQLFLSLGKTRDEEMKLIVLTLSECKQRVK